MNITIEKLKDWGCDVESALHRVIDDEDFYLECLKELADSPSFEELYKAIEDGKDEKRIFLAAHNLKGILANLGIEPLYKRVCVIVDSVRAKEGRDYSSDMKGIKEDKAIFDSIVR